MMVTTSGLLYLLRDFDQIGKGLKTIEDNIQRVHISTSLTYVIWSKFSRHVALKSVSGPSRDRVLTC